MLKKTSLYLLAALGMISCEEVLDDVKTEDSATLLTVEGDFTDSLEVQTLRLSWSGGYFAQSFDAGTGAAIALYDKKSGLLVTDYVENKDNLGLYSTVHPVAGVPGTVYQLRISIGGMHYIAEDSLAQVSTIDRISIAPNTFVKTVNSLYMDAVEPKDAVNFYTWDITFDSVMLDDYSNKPFSDDRLLGDSIKNISIYDDPFDGTQGYITDIEDTVKVHVRQKGISQEAYTFIVGMNAILNKGGMFDSPMAQVQSNLWRVDANMQRVEMQTGFFMCCGVSDIEIDFFENN